MNDLASLTAQPMPLRVGGKEYKVYPLTFSDLGALQAWVDAQFPSPFELANKAIAAGNYNVEQQKFLLKSALELAAKSRRLIGTPEADELLMSSEGYKQVLVLAIRKGDPGFSDKDAEELFRQMNPMDLASMQAATSLDMVLTDPKEPPLNIVPPKKPSGSATSRETRRRAKR